MYSDADRPGAARCQIDRIHKNCASRSALVSTPANRASSRPTHHRFVVLALAAILTLEGHAIAILLHRLGALAAGHPSSDQRVCSRDRWFSGTLAHRLAQEVHPQ